MTFSIAQGSFAQELATESPDESYAEAAAYVESNRDTIIDRIIEQWRPEMDANEDYVGWDAEIAAALESAPADKVLVALQARSYAEVVAALFSSWSGPDVTAIEDGQSPEDILQLGSIGDNLVFFPLTPCRIIDTRFGSFPFRIGPNSGRQFQVNLANSSSQGGFNGFCGVPTNVEPAAVAINAVSTSQTGNGNITIINTGGGIPTSALLNYTPGFNTANAAVVRSSTAVGNDIFIYSRFSATHVVVDIMGYFAAPERTALDNWVGLSSTVNVVNNGTASVFSPNCPSGYRVTGGGHIGTLFSDNWDILSSRPTRSNSIGLFTGANNTTQWLMQVRNSSGATRGFRTFVVCGRVPGR